MKKIFLVILTLVAFIACEKEEVGYYSGPVSSNVYVLGFNSYYETWYETDTLEYSDYDMEAQIRVRVSGVAQDKDMTFGLNFSGDVSPEILASLPKEITVKANTVQEDVVITILKPETDEDKARENILRVTLTNPEGIVPGQDNKAAFKFQ